MAKVLVQTFGRAPQTVDADNPAQIAEKLDIITENTSITINSAKGSLDSNLRENDFVSFTTSKVHSGR